MVVGGGNGGGGVLLNRFSISSLFLHSYCVSSTFPVSCLQEIPLEIIRLERAKGKGHLAPRRNNAEVYLMFMAGRRPLTMAMPV
jgi:hypothetical protein